MNVGTREYFDHLQKTTIGLTQTFVRVKPLMLYNI